MMVDGAELCNLAHAVGDMPQKQVLRDHAFTRGLDEAQIDHLAGIATPVAFEDDEVVLIDGARSTSFFLLLSGSLVERKAPAFGGGEPEAQNPPRPRIDSKGPQNPSLPCHFPRTARSEERRASK